MSSSAWVASHLFAMLGFILTALGLLAARRVTGPLATSAVITTWIGAGLTLPYYGARTSACTRSPRSSRRANGSTCSP